MDGSESVASKNDESSVDSDSDEEWGSAEKRVPWNLHECFTHRSYEDGFEVANTFSEPQRSLDSTLRTVAKIDGLQRVVRMLEQDNEELRTSLTALMNITMQNSNILKEINGTDSGVTTEAAGTSSPRP